MPGLGDRIRGVSAFHGVRLEGVHCIHMRKVSRTWLVNVYRASVKISHEEMGGVYASTYHTLGLNHGQYSMIHCIWYSCLASHSTVTQCTMYKSGCFSLWTFISWTEPHDTETKLYYIKYTAMSLHISDSIYALGHGNKKIQFLRSAHIYFLKLKVNTSCDLGYSAS